MRELYERLLHEEERYNRWWGVEATKAAQSTGEYKEKHQSQAMFYLGNKDQAQATMKHLINYCEAEAYEVTA